MKVVKNQTDKEVEPAKGFAPIEEPVEEKRVSYNSESGKVTLILQNGDRLTLAEPRAKAILLMQSWFNSAAEEMKSDAIAMVRLAYQCIRKYENEGTLIPIPDFDTFFEDLDIEDIERIGESLNFFRDTLEYLQRKAAV